MTRVFSEDLGVARNNPELEEIVRKYPGYSKSYLAVACGEGSGEQRKRIEQLWRIYHPCADKNFLEQIKVDFIARCWEMFIACVFLEQGFKLMPKTNSDGPDIHIKLDDNNAWVEAVSPKKGSGPDRVRDLVCGTIIRIPEEGILLRFTNSLASKYDQYQKYLDQGLVKGNEPFLIAMNRGEIDSPTQLVIPLIIKCLFGIGDPVVDVPLGGGEATSSWTSRQEVFKRSGSGVSTNFFENTEHKGISGVIYCGNDILNHPVILGKDCILIHNPYAFNPVWIDFLKVGYEWVPEDNSMRGYDRNRT